MSHTKRALWLSLSALLLLLTPAAHAEEPAPLASSGPFRPRLSLVDAPFNFHGGIPSMQQALDAENLVLGGGSWAINLFGERLQRNQLPCPWQSSRA